MVSTRSKIKQKRALTFEDIIQSQKARAASGEPGAAEHLAKLEKLGQQLQAQAGANQETADTVKKGLTDTTGSGLNSNVIKLAEKIEETRQPSPAAVQPTPPEAKPKTPLPTYKQAVKNWLQDKKKIASVEGFFDVERSSGLLGNLLKTYVARKKAATPQDVPEVADDFVKATGTSKKKRTTPLAAVKQATKNLVGAEETRQEESLEVQKQTDILNRIESHTAVLPDLVMAIKGIKPQEPAAQPSTGAGLPSLPSLPVPPGGVMKTLSRGVASAGRGLLGAGRAALGFVGGGSVAMGASVIGGALLAGYAGKKLRERVEEKEAVNRAEEQKEITENKIDVEDLKKLPDEGKAIAPGTINKVDRARNLMEQRVEAKQSFTEEEAQLAKQKLGVDVPKELIGAKDTQVASEASKSDYSKSVASQVSESDFMKKDPETFSKFSEERQQRTKQIVEDDIKKVESAKYKTDADKEIALKIAKSPGAKHKAYAQATNEMYQKYSKEIQAAGAGAVTVKETGEKAAQASTPTSQTGSTALRQAEAATGGVKTGEIVAGASMTGAGVNQQMALTQAGVERNAGQIAGEASQPAQPAVPVEKAPTTSAQVQGAKQTGPGRYEGTLSGVTSDDITSNPNYQKYYEQALHGRTGPDAERMARKSASLRVQGDMMKAAAPAPTAADAVYGKSAENKAAEQSSSPVVNAPIINAPSTNVQQTTNNAVRNPARNTESSLHWYTRSRFA